MNKLNLTVLDNNSVIHEITYQLEDNDIARRWYKKILHLHRLPFSEHYNNSVSSLSTLQINHSLREDLNKLNNLIDLNFPLKGSYDQNDCNILHSITLSTQYSFDSKIREIFHKMHRLIHELESKLNEQNKKSLYAGWGEKEGPLTSNFDSLPYKFYKESLPGCLSLKWAEFGKTPWEFWRDGEKNDLIHFLETCLPHVTFRAQFSLTLSHQTLTFDEKFYTWFSEYKDVWYKKYQIDWNPLYQWGGIVLAVPDKSFDWLQINKILNIKPIKK